jgi:hypothetical protein
MTSKNGEVQEFFLSIPHHTTELTKEMVAGVVGK